MNRFQFVADHQTTYQVKRLCQVLELSRSSFYAWQKAGPARQQREQADAQLAARIRAVQDPKAGGVTPPTARRGSPPNSTTAPSHRRG